MAVDHSIDVGELLGVTFGSVSEAARNAITARLRSLAADLREYLLEVWPVLSAASLQEWEVRSSAFMLLVRNPVDYAEFVHRSGDPTLVHEEIGDRAQEMVDDVLPELEQILADNPLWQDTSISAAPQPAPTLSSFLTQALFQAKTLAFGRVGMLERDRLRAGFATRTPRPRQLPLPRPIGR